MDHPDAVKKTVILELIAIGDGLSGRVLCEHGPARDFSGRLGLMRAIDDLIEEEGPDQSQGEGAGSPRA